MLARVANIAGPVSLTRSCSASWMARIIHCPLVLAVRCSVGRMRAFRVRFHTRSYCALHKSVELAAACARCCAAPALLIAHARRTGLLNRSFWKAPLSRASMRSAGPIGQDPPGHGQCSPGPSGSSGSRGLKARFLVVRGEINSNSLLRPAASPRSNLKLYSNSQLRSTSRYVEPKFRNRSEPISLAEENRSIL